MSELPSDLDATERIDPAAAAPDASSERPHRSGSGRPRAVTAEAGTVAGPASPPAGRPPSPEPTSAARRPPSGSRWAARWAWSTPACRSWCSSSSTRSAGWAGAIGAAVAAGRASSRSCGSPASGRSPRPSAACSASASPRSSPTAPARPRATSCSASGATCSTAALCCCRSWSAGRWSACIWEAINGRGTAWRKDRALVRRYDWATFVWVVVFAVRFLVQNHLYDTDQVGWLAAVRLLMGYPLFIVAIVVTVLIVGQGSRPGCGCPVAAQRRTRPQPRQPDRPAAPGRADAVLSRRRRSAQGLPHVRSPPRWRRRTAARRPAPAARPGCGTITRPPRRIVTRAASRGSVHVAHRPAGDAAWSAAG